MASIWEKMVIEERRQIAASLGKRISDLEEEQMLLNTLLASQAEADIDPVPATMKQPVMIIEDHGHSQSHEAVEMAEEFDHVDFLEAISETEFKVEKINAFDQKLLKEGGRWYQLPQVLVDQILMFLCDPDALGYLHIASKSTFQPSDKVYRFICEQIYPKQTSKRICRIERWRSWRNMLIHRPRLRTNGFYTLRTMFTKAYCNDAFWEEKVHTSIELKYYRHMRFFENGQMLYSLDIADPHDMVRLLEPGQPIPRRLYAGTYTLTRDIVTVEVPLHYCDMRFELQITSEDDGFRGNHNGLRLISHTSNVGGAHRLHHAVSYPIPVFATFRFYRCWHFMPHVPVATNGGKSGAGGGSVSKR
jgi:hypothetical protein